MRYIILFICLIFLPCLAGAEEHFTSQQLGKLRVVQTNPPAKSAEILGNGGTTVTVYVGDNLSNIRARIVAINATSITVKTAKGRTRISMIGGSSFRTN